MERDEGMVGEGVYAPEQSIRDVTGGESSWYSSWMEGPEEGWSLESSTGNCVPLATGEPAKAFEETGPLEGTVGPNAESR